MHTIVLVAILLGLVLVSPVVLTVQQIMPVFRASPFKFGFSFDSNVVSGRFVEPQEPGSGGGGGGTI